MTDSIKSRKAREESIFYMDENLQKYIEKVSVCYIKKKDVVSESKNRLKNIMIYGIMIIK